MSNGLDPDQARRFVGPDLGLNCLQDLQQATDFTISRLKHVHVVETIIQGLYIIDFCRLLQRGARLAPTKCRADPCYTLIVPLKDRERNGSVSECLTRDEGPRGRASPASLRCVFEKEH